MCVLHGVLLVYADDEVDLQSLQELNKVCVCVRLSLCVFCRLRRAYVYDAREPPSL